MVQEEINQIKSIVNKLEKIDIVEEIKNEIESVGGVLETTKTGDISAISFINFFELALKGLKNLITSDLNIMIPSRMAYNPDPFRVRLSGDDFINIPGELSMLYSRIEDSNFNSATQHLKNIIYYLNLNNLLPKNGEILKAFEINKLNKEIELKRDILDKALNDKDTLFDNLHRKVEDQNKLIEELQNELKEANRKNEAINELLLQSTANEQKITNLVGNFEHEFDKLNKQSAETQKGLRDIQNTFKKSVEEVVEFNKSTSIIAKEMHNKSADFDVQLSKLNELLGKQAASSLFSTFKVRKEELSKPVTRWMLITFGAGGFALLWVIAVFTNFFGLVASQSINIDATFLILNSLKSVPAIILLYFSIRQYVRERNMQEEYAFRSAIALTIQAYGDMVGDKKHELIMAATSTIYAMPSVMKERGFSLFRKKENGLTEIMKQLNETLKTVQSNK